MMSALGGIGEALWTSAARPRRKDSRRAPSARGAKRDSCRQATAVAAPRGQGMPPQGGRLAASGAKTRTDRREGTDRPPNGVRPELPRVRS